MLDPCCQLLCLSCIRLLLRSPSLPSLQGWMNFTLTSEMPSYFSDVLGFNIMMSGVLCVFPYMALFGSALLFGRIFEHLQRSGAMSVDTVRKAAQFIAYFCSGCTLVLCSFSNTDTMHSYGLMIATMVRPPALLH